MDANGTRYHLLLGKADWAACSDSARDLAGPSRTLGEQWTIAPASTALAWNCETKELTLRPNLSLVVPPVGTVPLLPEARRGAARDRYGNWYWIAASGTEIVVNSSGSRVTTHFWSSADLSECAEDASGDFRPVVLAEPPVARLLRGLTVTADHYLVVGSESSAGLFVFDLHSGGPPREIRWPAEVAFSPFDMAPRSCGGVWILDRAHKRFWALDRSLRTEAVGPDVVALLALEEVFGAADSCAMPPPAVVRTCPAGVNLDAAAPLVAVADPVAIEALPDGTVLILDRNPGEPFSRVFRYRGAEQLNHPLSLDIVKDVLEADQAVGFALTAHDFAFVPEHQDASAATVGDRLFVVSDTGVQAFVFAVTLEDGRLDLTALPDYLPLRLFGGKALVGAGGAAYYDFADRWVPLVAQRRPRYAPEGTLYTPLRLSKGESGRPAFDGREPGCVWHRLMIDGCLPPESEVRIESRAADEPAALFHAAWMPEPTLYRRGDGSELPFAEALGGDYRGTWELLFQRARGRFLQLKLTLSGNGRNTPRLHAVRAYYPRFSYLARYLPAVYRENDASASFLDRFLANPEGTFTATEDRVAAVQVLFDPDSAPASVLPWLARWFELALDPTWDDDRRRFVIKHAMQLFQMRGTKHGLEIALRLALDGCVDESLFDEPDCGCARSPWAVRIVEQFRTRRFVGLPDKYTPTTGGLWQPQNGIAALHARYTAFLGDTSGTITEFPLIGPVGAAANWERFCRAALGFVPAAKAEDLGCWQDFLARRYGRVSALNTAHGSNWSSFPVVPLFTKLPVAEAATRDWYEFESVVVRMARAAHRFTVLVPAPRVDVPDHTEQRRRLDLAKRVIDQEKPAHTVLDIQFFWAYFRVGFARLGDDSLIDQGSRAAELHPPVRLGEEYVGGSFLTAGHPQNVIDRQVLGRDRLGHGRSPEGDES